MVVPRWVWGIVAATLALAIVANVAAASVGRPAPTMFGFYSLLASCFLFVLGSASLLGYVLKLAWRREPDPVPAILATVRAKLAPQWLSTHVVPIFATLAMMGAFSSLKAMIPAFVPFYSDSAWIEADRFVPPREIGMR